MVSGQWTEPSGQWLVDSGQKDAANSGQWLVDSGQKDANDNFIYYFCSLLNK